MIPEALNYHLNLKFLLPNVKWDFISIRCFVITYAFYNLFQSLSVLFRDGATVIKFVWQNDRGAAGAEASAEGTRMEPMGWGLGRGVPSPAD